MCREVTASASLPIMLNEPSPSSAFSAQTARGRKARHRLAVLVVAAASMVVASCGGSGASDSAELSTTGTVLPPDVPMQGCTYEINGKVPPGEYQGVQPDFGAYSPDSAAVAAVQSIKAHGGTGLVYGFSFPTGVKLYAGPDTAHVVGTVPDGNSVTTSEPVLWTTRSGARWLAFFIACGGKNLYWVSVDQVRRVSTNEGGLLEKKIPELLAAPPYAPPTNTKASALPLTISSSKQFAWKNSAIPFVIARGQLLGF